MNLSYDVDHMMIDGELTSNSIAQAPQEGTGQCEPGILKSISLLRIPLGHTIVVALATISYRASLHS